MERILLTWELGSGVGHLLRLRQVAQSLLKQRHKVFLALGDLSTVGRIFSDMDVTVLQAPLKVNPSADAVRLPATHAHILHNCGFADPMELSGRTAAWKILYKMIRPGLILFEHSPTALLAARSFNTKKVLLGNSFFCPPDIYPLPNMRHWCRMEGGTLKNDEDRVTETINSLLRSWRLQPLKRLAELYQDVDENIFATFEELDHFGPRSNVRYCGTWLSQNGLHPEYPTLKGPKIFVHLKPGTVTDRVLAFLQKSRLPTLVYVPGLPHEIRRQYTGSNMHFSNKPVNLSEAAEQCDLAVTNGTHGATSAMLLAGKPVVMLPMTLEQYLFAERVKEMGAGLLIGQGNEEMLEDRLLFALSDRQTAGKAHAFSSRYSSVNASDQFEEMISRITDLLTPSLTNYRTISRLSKSVHWN